MVIYWILGLSVLGLAVALFYAQKVTRIPIDAAADSEEEGRKLKKIHRAIADGAMAFLTQEYKYMIIFMITFSFIIALAINDEHTPDLNEGIYTAVSFVLGCLVSILSGFIGMKIATAGNVRTAAAAKKSITQAFNVALQSGSVMGFGLVGLATLGMLLVYLGMDALLPW